MVRHVWPTVDPDEETQASLAAYVAAIPRRVKKMFGYDDRMDLHAKAERDAEIDRLAEYAQRWELEITAED